MVSRSVWQTGDVFRLFMISYALWRVGIDFLKPEPSAGLSLIQWCAWRSGVLLRILDGLLGRRILFSQRQ